MESLKQCILEANKDENVLNKSDYSEIVHIIDYFFDQMHGDMRENAIRIRNTIRSNKIYKK